MSRLFRSSKRRHVAGKGDSGFTLPELLITVVVSGLLIGVIASAFSVFIRATPRAELKLAQSADVSLLQSWIPSDLSSAVKSSDETLDSSVALTLKSTTPGPSVTFPDNLDEAQYGFNVLTLVLRLANGGETIASYRYVQDGDNWQIVRLGIDPVSGAVISANVIAREVEPAPAGWTPAEGTGHAVVISERPIIGRVSKTVTVKFRDSANTFTTTGAGLIAETELVSLPETLTPDPPKNFSRCGGNITLMLDTSWSVPRFLGGEDMKSAAAAFVRALEGTPTRVSVMGFDGIAYQLYPNLNGTRGTFFAADDADDTVDEIDEAIFNITQLPDRDRADQEFDYYNEDPGTGIGPETDKEIGWTLVRTNEDDSEARDGGTNWEDAILSPFIAQDGTARTEIPRKVIWITDGEPNTSRNPYVDNPSLTAEQNQANSDAAALTAARDAVARIPVSSQVVGVLVGPGGMLDLDGSRSDLEDNLRSVVGDVRWTGSGADDLQNIDAANYISSTFAGLEEVLAAIAISDCGGVVTVRKSFDDDSTPRGEWKYSTPEGVAILDTDDTLSVPISFSFGPGQGVKEVTIFEEAPDGAELTSAECSAGGSFVPSTLDPENQSVTLTVKADTAISCKFISSAAN